MSYDAHVDAQNDYISWWWINGHRVTINTKHEAEVFSWLLDRGYQYQTGSSNPYTYSVYYHLWNVDGVFMSIDFHPDRGDDAMLFKLTFA